MALVSDAARIIAAEWPNILDKDDAQSLIMISVLEHNLTATIRDKVEPAKRVSYLVQIGRRIANKERVDYERFTGNLLYSTRDVRALLDAGALLNVDGGLFSASMTDVRLAVKTLPAQHREVLERRWRFNETVIDRKSITRAVDALAAFMNRRAGAAHEGPGSRNAMTNSAAQAALRFDY